MINPVLIVHTVIIDLFSMSKTVIVFVSRALRALGYTISPTTGFVMNCNKPELWIAWIRI